MRTSRLILGSVTMKGVMRTSRLIRGSDAMKGIVPDERPKCYGIAIISIIRTKQFISIVCEPINDWTEISRLNSLQICRHWCLAISQSLDSAGKELSVRCRRWPTHELMTRPLARLPPDAESTDWKSESCTIVARNPYLTSRTWHELRALRPAIWLYHLASLV